MAEILASLDDINAQLPSDDDSPVVVADEENTGLLQISVARIVRGNLSRVVDNVLLFSWASPESTPELIREAASKLIASQLYLNRIAKTTSVIDADSVPQVLYNQGMAILTGIIDGTITLPNVVISDLEDMTDLDYFPTSATDRAFTRSMNL